VRWPARLHPLHPRPSPERRDDSARLRTNRRSGIAGQALCSDRPPHACRKGRDARAVRGRAGNGLHLLPGLFLPRPEVLRAREIPTNQANYLRLFAAVSKDEMDQRELEPIIKVEASILYRLRYLNSPISGERNEIHMWWQAMQWPPAGEQHRRGEYRKALRDSVPFASPPQTRAKVRGRARHLCAKSALLWTCTNYAAQRSIKVFPAATLLVLALCAH